MALGSCVDIIGAKGTRVFIGAALPASYTESGYEAVTWTEIGMIESIGEFGPEATIGSFTPLATGIACKSMGVSDNGEITISVARSTDTGLAALIAHQGQTANRPFMIQLSDYGDPKTGVSLSADSWPGVATGAKASRFFFPGLTKSTRTSIGTGDDTVKLSATIVINGAFITAAPEDSTTA